MNSKLFAAVFFQLSALYAGTTWALFGEITTVTLSGALTIPLLSATAGTLATPLAVLGVLKLGAAALYGLGYFTLGSKKGGGDDGYAPVESSGYGYYRQRRSADQGVAAPDKEALFALISALDTHGCGKQLICELEAKSQLEYDEQLLVGLFSKNKKVVVNPVSPKAEYDLAAELGKASKNQLLCRARYVTCPYTGEEMMAALRSSKL